MRRTRVGKREAQLRVVSKWKERHRAEKSTSPSTIRKRRELEVLQEEVDKSLGNSSEKHSVIEHRHHSDCRRSLLFDQELGRKKRCECNNLAKVDWNILPRSVMQLFPSQLPTPLQASSRTGLFEQELGLSGEASEDEARRNALQLRHLQFHVRGNRIGRSVGRKSKLARAMAEKSDSESG